MNSERSIHLTPSIYKSLKASPLPGADDNLNTAFPNYTNQEERDQSYGFNVASSESLLVLVNNYVKATRFVFWLRENVPNPEEKGVLGKVHEEQVKERVQTTFELPRTVGRFGDKGRFNNLRRFPRV